MTTNSSTGTADTRKAAAAAWDVVLLALAEQVAEQTHVACPPTLRAPDGSSLQSAVLVDPSRRQWVAEVVTERQRREVYRGPSRVLAKAVAAQRLYDAMPPGETADLDEAVMSAGNMARQMAGKIKDAVVGGDQEAPCTP